MRPRLGTPVGVNTGPLAAAAWLAELGLTPSEKRWFVELDVGTGPRSTRFQLDIYAEEWGYRFHHDGRRSWIRVTDIPFVHGADDHELLAVTPPLRNIGRVMRDLEARYEIELPRDDVSVRTNVDGAESIVRAWARML